MLTEPIGPRSPDEILAAVYRRTDRVRRRRQQLAAAAAVVALGLGGLLSLQSAVDDDASRVRVVDRDDTQDVTHDEEPEAATSSSPPSAASTDDTTATTAAAQPNDEPAPSNENASPAPTAPPAPTTTTTVTLPSGPQVELLAETGDMAGDSTPSAWYWDIVHGSMHMDLASDVVVFTTRYRTPSSPGPRDTRILRTSFDVDNNTVNVSVTETDNTLGVVKLDGQDCTECTRSFDEAEGELRILVPVERMESHLQSLGSSMADGVGGIRVFTGATDVDDLGAADTAGGEE